MNVHPRVDMLGVLRIARIGTGIPLNYNANIVQSKGNTGWVVREYLYHRNKSQVHRGTGTRADPNRASSSPSQ